MNDEMFRKSLIEITNSDLLNEFVNKIFKYRLKDDEYIYMQYKLVNKNIVLNIFDNSKKNRFKAFIFSLDDFNNDDEIVIYINVRSCYQRYRDKKTKNKLYLLGALLMSNDDKEKRDIINSLFDNDIKNIFINNFI